MTAGHMRNLILRFFSRRTANLRFDKPLQSSLGVRSEAEKGGLRRVRAERPYVLFQD